MTKTTHFTGTGTVVAAVLCLAALSACGGSPVGGSDDTAKDDQVASVTSPAAKDGASASASSGTEEGVPLRTDMSEDEKKRIQTAWGVCLKSQGVPTADKGIPGMVLPAAGADKYPKEYKACKAKQPITPPQLNPNDPDYADGLRSWVRCMNDKGLKVDTLPDAAGWTWAYEPGPVAPGSSQADQIEANCQEEALSAKK
ncbi:hypothetical protein ACWD4T_24270 [Streptomyces umbrinus]